MNQTGDNSTFLPMDWQSVTSENYSLDANETLIVKKPNVVESVVILSCIVLVIALNAFMFVVIRGMKTVNKSTVDGMLSLGIADMMLGTAGAIYIAFNYLQADFNMTVDNPVCMMYAFVSTYLANISIITLTFLNIDKLLIFAYPLKYPVVMTTRKFRLILIFIWVLQLPIAVAPLFNWNGAVIMVDRDAYICMWDWRTGKVFLIIMFLGTQQFPTYGNIVAFLGILCIIYRRKAPGANAAAGGAQQDSKHAKNVRLVRTLALMTLGFYAAWTPFTTYITGPALFSGTFPFRWAHFFSAWLGGSNSFWNPIIYMATLRPFQESASALVRCKRPA